MDIVGQLKYAGDHFLFVPHLYQSAADEIIKLREVLLTVLEACEDVNSPDRKVREEIARTVGKALKGGE